MGARKEFHPLFPDLWKRYVYRQLYFIHSFVLPGIQIYTRDIIVVYTRVPDLECLMNSERLSPTIQFCNQPAYPSE